MTEAAEDVGGEEGGEKAIEPTAEEVQAQESVNAEAEAMGWRPDFDGPGAKTAQEFIDFGSTRTPVLKERLDKSIEDNRLMFDQVKTLTDTVEGFQAQYIEGTRKAREDERSKTITELEGQRRTAAADGEMDEFDRLGNVIDKERAKPIDVPKTQVQQAPKIDPSFHGWHAENSWYQTDRALTGAADAIGESLLAANPNLQGKEFYVEVERQIKLEFPQKFGGNGKVHPSTEGRRTPPARKTEKNTWDDIPKDDRQDALTQIGDGCMFADKDAYTKKYFEMYPGEG